MSAQDPHAAPAATDADSQRQWWGTFSLPAGSGGFWQVGPLSLWVGRTDHQWQIACARDASPFRDDTRVEVPADAERRPIPDDAEQHRVAFGQTDERLELRPVLADRPVVARPETKFCIPPRERVSVFVSSAIWVRLETGPRSERLLELPSWRASDTWFGTNRSGFLCYATRTTMRLEFSEMPLRRQRAVTPIVIDNQGKDPLHIERISLPVPNLSVFASPSGNLWTEELHLTRRDDAELAHVRIEKKKPPRPGAIRLSEPRNLVVEDNLLSRVFTGLFG